MVEELPLAVVLLVEAFEEAVVGVEPVVVVVEEVAGEVELDDELVVVGEITVVAV